MSWVIQNNTLTNTDFISLPDKPFVGDSPYTMWRIVSGTNNDMPFSPLMIGLPSYHFVSVPQRDYITVYDLRTPQNGFNNHGLCILQPTLCRVTEVLNGEYSAYLEHPIDDLERWTYLVEMNILKIQGQLFVINRVCHTFNGAVGTVSVYANHIFYVLNDRWLKYRTMIIYPGQANTWTVQKIMQNAYLLADAKPRTTDIIYDYSYSSDIDGIYYYLRNQNGWDTLESGMTFNEFLLGDNGLVESVGGELYRDNFYFSLNDRKEYSTDDAFEIRLGHNMKGITREIDTSSLCTYLIGYDAYGHTFEIAVSGEYPHHIVRDVTFSGISTQAALEAATTEVFNKNKLPKLMYRVDLIDTIDNPDFEEVTKHADYAVGNIGYIYDERLALLGLDPRAEVKVTKRITDGITGETLSVEFGDTPSLTRPRKTGRVLSKAEKEEMYMYTRLQAKTLGEWMLVSNYTWGELAKFTWYQCNGNSDEAPDL